MLSARFDSLTYECRRANEMTGAVNTSMSCTSIVNLFSYTLRNCVPLRAFAQARQTHAQILIHGLNHHLTLQTDLLLVYSRCGFLEYARQVFDKMLEKNMHSWNIMIGSYTQNSLYMSALALFHLFLKMGSRPPDHYTLPPVFKACAEVRDFLLGISLHSWVVRLGFEDHIVIGSSLLDFYSKCDCLTDAHSVFVKMPRKDTVAWNSMISGFARANLHFEALNCFRDMLEVGVKIDNMTIPSILNACGKEGNVTTGKQMHGQVVKNVIFVEDTAIGNSLIDMYSKCGCLCTAEKIFQNMRERNLVTWTTLISCFGVHGRGKESLVMFKKMKDSGIEPNNVTLTAILASCSHSGYIDDGRRIFNSIGEPSVEHFACVVDLLGRFGCLEEALGLIKNMKFVPTASVWGALLSGCMMHKNVEIGEIAAEHLFELEPKNSSNYIALCSIYDYLGNRSGVTKIRSTMREMGLVKNPGCSWITDNRGDVHKFYQGDISHPLNGIIYETLTAIFRTSRILTNKDCNTEIT